MHHMDTDQGYGEKFDSNYTRMLWAVLNNSWRQHLIKQQLYCHLSPIMKTIQIRWTKPAGYCWRRTDKLISDVLLWTPSHGRAKVGQPGRTYLQQLWVDTDEWQERVREIHTSSTTWLYIHTHSIGDIKNSL